MNNKCKKGHDLVSTNIYITPSTGRRKCKICLNTYNQINNERRKEISILWQKSHPKRVAEINKKHRDTDEFRKKHRVRMRVYWKKYLPRLQKDVLTHYGHGKLACVCCGEPNILFLTIDHVNGRKTEHEKKHWKHRGWMLKQYLRKNGYPEGYQTLCWNCNSGRALNKGICPHKT